MSFCLLFLQCWVRRFPPVAMLLPKLDLLKKQRAAWLVLHLNCALGVASVVSVFLGTPSGLSDDVHADQVEFLNLWADLAPAFRAAWLPGLVCYIAAQLVTLAAGPRAVSTPPEFTSDRKQEMWVQQAKKDGDRQAMKCIMLSLVFAASGVVICALFPQPRAAVALAAFIFGHVGLYLITIPVLRAFADTVILWRAAKSARHDCLLSLCPSLLDFSHCQIQSWSSGVEITSHWEIVLEQLKIIRWAMEERQLFAKELGMMSLSA